MKVKEAIEKLNKVIYWDEIDHSIVELEIKEANDIISLLQQGEKYKAIYKNIINRINSVVNNRKLGWTTNLDTPEDIKQLLDELEQKYFPKEIKNADNNK